MREGLKIVAVYYWCRCFYGGPNWFCWGFWIFFVCFCYCWEVLFVLLSLLKYFIMILHRFFSAGLWVGYCQDSLPLWRHWPVYLYNMWSQWKLIVPIILNGVLFLTNLKKKNLKKPPTRVACACLWKYKSSYFWVKEYNSCYILLTATFF